MKSSILSKLETLTKRQQYLETLLQEPNTISDHKKFRILSKEYGQLATLVEYFQRWKIVQKNIIDTRMILQDSEIRDIAEDDLKQLHIDRVSIENKLQLLLESRTSNNISGCFLEVRAGTGGYEAALFARELFRMYNRYAEKYRWKVEVINLTNGEQGGFKDVIIKIFHVDAYQRLRFESGGHRVQRVPYTESQGRVHTSSCMVAVVPEIPDVEWKVHHSDLRIDTFRASGAGGQHVNTTDSAIRITHIPSGIVVACQDERSQHKNKAKALEVLQARLIALELKRKQQESSYIRKNLLGTGDRSDRIRTYNFHQNRVTDHRINFTVYALNEIIGGNLDILVQPLIERYESG